MTSRISAAEARNRFSDILNRAYYRGEATIVERQGKPVAAIINVEQYEQFQAQQKRDLFETIRAIQEHNREADPDEVYRDVTEAVEEIRQEEYDRSARTTPQSRH